MCELSHIASVLEGGQYRYPQRDCTPAPASVSRIVTESGPAAARARHVERDQPGAVIAISQAQSYRGYRRQSSAVHR
jgi:hypothetical protein